MVAESTASFSKLLVLGRLLNGKASEQTSQLRSGKYKHLSTCLLVTEDPQCLLVVGSC